jgi:hypothetical protein
MEVPGGTGMSIFRRLAQRITVSDIQYPLGPSLTMDMSDDEVLRATHGSADGDDPPERFSLVVDERGTPTHYFDNATYESVREGAEPLNPGVLVSSDTTALAALRRFGTRDGFLAFVLRESSITGLLYGASFFKPECSICVLAMLLEVERTCLELALRDPESSWAQLTPGRQAKAREVYAMRYKVDSARASCYHLLHYTTFVDKQTLIRDMPEAALLGRRWLNDFFKEAELYRNYFAHAAEENLFELPGLAKLTSDMESFIQRIAPAAEPPIRLVR